MIAPGKLPYFTIWKILGLCSQFSKNDNIITPSRVSESVPQNMMDTLMPYQRKKYKPCTIFVKNIVTTYAQGKLTGLVSSGSNVAIVVKIE